MLERCIFPNFAKVEKVTCIVSCLVRCTGLRPSCFIHKIESFYQLTFDNSYIHSWNFIFSNYLRFVKPLRQLVLAEMGKLSQTITPQHF